MWLVNAALVPGAFAMTFFFGVGVLANLLFAITLAVTVEVLCLGLIQGAGSLTTTVPQTCSDGSSVLTGALIALALPPGCSIVVIGVAVAIAISIGKHAFGGLGRNPFNPAMVGYAVVLVSYPHALAQWPVSIDGTITGVLDGSTGATALDVVKHRQGELLSDLWNTRPELFARYGAAGFQWVNVAFLAGGVFMVWLKLIQWRISVAMLVTLGALAAMFYDGGSSASLGSPAFHWLSGGTMLAAFFIVTDPVTHPSHARAQIAFGVLVGVLIFAIRARGAYPDGIAFAVLLANAATPFLDQYGKPTQ